MFNCALTSFHVISSAGLLDGVRLSWADLPQERYNKLKQVSGPWGKRSA